MSEVELLEPGIEISVRFRPAKNLPFINAQARVRYVLEGVGTGVEFTNISTEDRMRLLRVIHRHTGDRRTRPRAPLATQVQCKECYSLTFSRDLSLCGMFVETKSPLPIGSPLTVRFNLNDNNQVVIAAAHVHYRLAKMGMGILFDDLLPEHRQAIEDYLGSRHEFSPERTATGSCAR